MSSLLILRRCANAYCSNMLKEWEMQKLAIQQYERRLHKLAFCGTCRKTINKVDYIRCAQCGQITAFENWNKKCRKCVEFNRKKRPFNK